MLKGQSWLVEAQTPESRVVLSCAAAASLRDPMAQMALLALTCAAQRLLLVIVQRLSTSTAPRTMRHC